MSTYNLIFETFSPAIAEFVNSSIQGTVTFQRFNNLASALHNIQGKRIDGRLVTLLNRLISNKRYNCEKEKLSLQISRKLMTLVEYKFAYNYEPELLKQEIRELMNKLVLEL